MSPPAAPWMPEPGVRRWRLADVLALAIWTAAIVVFFWDAVTFHGAFFYFDVTEINIPYRDFLAQELKSGRFARWHPGLYCGLPLYSESQAGYFHPLKYPLYPFLPTWKAFNLDTVLSVWLTGLFAYGWLRRHVGAVGALSGAALLGFSGYTWAHLIHTSMINALPSVPLAFWAIECCWESGRLRGAAVAGLALACQVFAGHLQDTILTGLALSVYGTYRAAVEPGWRRKAFALGTVGLVGLVTVLVSAVQWVPSKELIDRSPRQEMTWDELTYGSWHPELLPTLLVREAYGTRARDTDWMDGYYPYHEMNAYMGVVGLMLAVLGMAAWRDRWVGAWLILGGVGLLLMLGRFTFLMDRFTEIPFIGRGRVPVRYHLWVTVSAAALAAVGADRIARGGWVRLRPALWVLGLLVLASLPILVYVYEPAVTDRQRWPLRSHADRFAWLGADIAWGSARSAALVALAIVAARLAGRSADSRRRPSIAWALPLLLIVDLLAAHRHDAPTIDPAYWTEEPPSARWLKERPDLGRIFGEGLLASGEPGYASEPVNFLAVRELLAWSLPPVWGLRSIGGETPIIPARRLRFTDHADGRARLDIEGLSHIVTTSPARSDVPLDRVGSVVIIANPAPLARARVVGRPDYVESEREAGRALRALGSTIRERLVIEDPDRPVGADADPRGTAEILLDEPERVELSVETDSPGYLFLADTFDPGWSATLNGKSVPIRPAYATFRAVAIPEGRHMVVFTYRPAGWKVGLSVTLGGLVLTLLLLAWPRRLAPLGDGHTEPWRGWPWPWAWVALMTLIVVASTVGLDSNSRPTLHGRWHDRLHRFTWGAGIEAMKPPRLPLD